MYARCIDAAGMDGQLTEDKIYPVLESKHNKFRMRDDSGQINWHGCGHFDKPSLSIRVLWEQQNDCSQPT